MGVRRQDTEKLVRAIDATPWVELTGDEDAAAFVERLERPRGAPGSVGPGTPEEQARMRACPKNRLHPRLMLGRTCGCGYEGRA